MHRIKNPNDVLTGIFLVAMAGLGLYLSWRLHAGTAAAMGPGYVPKMLCIILTGLGIANIVNGFFSEGEPFEAWHFWPLAWVLSGVAFFTYSVERFGLVVAVIGLVLLGCVGHQGTKWYSATILAIGLAMFSWLLFVKALGLPMLAWPPMLVGQ